MAYTAPSRVPWLRVQDVNVYPVSVWPALEDPAAAVGVPAASSVSRTTRLHRSAGGAAERLRSGRGL